MELRGEIRGGRFVGGEFTGEQYALPRAVVMLRSRRTAPEVASTQLLARLAPIVGETRPEDVVRSRTGREVDSRSPFAPPAGA
jgi:hypothetical protein